jgi:hypothetical protein
MANPDGASIDWTDPVKATAAVRAALDEMSEDQIRDLNSTQLFLIQNMTGRIEYAESRRGGFATIAAGFIAAGIALISIGLDQGSRHLSVLLGVFGGAIALTGAAVLWLFGRQTNPKYGFIKKSTKLQRPWKWFYRDALGDSDAFRYHWFSKGDSKENLAPAEAFDDQWGEFAHRQVRLADLREDTLQNMKQVYLLHVNERYKNLFLSEVRRVLITGLILSVLVAAAAFAISFAGPGGAKVPEDSPTVSAAMS